MVPNEVAASAAVDPDGAQAAVEVSSPSPVPETTSRRGYGVPLLATSSVESPPLTATTEAPLSLVTVFDSLVADADVTMQSARVVRSVKPEKPATKLAAFVGVSATHEFPSLAAAAAPSASAKKSSPCR